MGQKTINSTLNFMFWFHLLITLLAFVAPFLFSWYLVVPVYAIVIIQFIIFGECLMNETHDLDNAEDATFYSTLFESMGFQPNRRFLKLFVRRYLYVLLGLFTLFWQLWLGKAPLLF